MTRHNNDIAACEGNGCPMRTTCLRWQLGQTMGDYQWFAIFDPKHCEYYIHNEPNNENKNEND